VIGLEVASYTKTATSVVKVIYKVYIFKQASTIVITRYVGLLERSLVRGRKHLNKSTRRWVCVGDGFSFQLSATGDGLPLS
jgi:hypothetical protein